MIYLDNTQDLQEVWVPRNDGIRATRDDCFSTGYDSGYTDGYNDGRMSGASLQEKDVVISSAQTEVRPDDGYDGLSAVRIDAEQYGETMRGEGYNEGYKEGKESVALSNLNAIANGVYYPKDHPRQYFTFTGGSWFDDTLDYNFGFVCTFRMTRESSGYILHKNDSMSRDGGSITVDGTAETVSFEFNGMSGTAAVSLGIWHTIQLCPNAGIFRLDGQDMPYDGTYSPEGTLWQWFFYNLSGTDVYEFNKWNDYSSDTAPYDRNFIVRKDEYGPAGFYDNVREEWFYLEGNQPEYKEETVDGWNSVTVSVRSKLEWGNITVTADTQTVYPGVGYDGFVVADIDATEYGNSKYEEGKAAVPLQEKSAVMTAATMDVLPDGGYSGMSKVSVSAEEYGQERYQEGYSYVSSRVVPTAVTMDSENLHLEAEDETGETYGYSQVTVDAADFVQGEREKSYTSGYTEGQENIRSGIGATALTQNGVYTPQPDDTAQYGWSSVTVNVPQTGTAINNQSKTVNITANGTRNVTYDEGYTGLENVEVTVNVPQTGATINNQSKTVEITANGTTEVSYDSGYTGLEKVKVNVNVPQSGGDVTVISLTQAEYDALDNPDPNAIYLITDGVIGCLDPNKFPFKDYPDLDYKSMDWVSVPQWIDFEGVVDISSKFRDMLSLTEAKIRSNTITTAVDTFNTDTNITDVYIDCPEMVDIRGMFNGCKEIRRAVFTSTKLHDVNVCLDWCDKIEYLEMGGLVNNPAGNSWDDYAIFMAGGGDALTGVTIGTLPDYDLSEIGFNRCSNLTHESLVGLLNALPQATGDYSFAIGGVNIAKLSEDEIAIATDKGWSLR